MLPNPSTFSYCKISCCCNKFLSLLITRKVNFTRASSVDQTSKGKSASTRREALQAYQKPLSIFLSILFSPRSNHNKELTCQVSTSYYLSKRAITAEICIRYINADSITIQRDETTLVYTGKFRTS